MIEPIAPIAGPTPPQAGVVQPPEALKLRAALNGARRFIVQFAPGTPLPDGDEIACTAAALSGVIPDDVQRSLTFSESTAWLCRLYPAGLGQQLDALAAEQGDESMWPDATRPGFSRYYRLRFTGGMDDDYILGALARADTIVTAQPEIELDIVVSAVNPSDDPNFKDQDYLKAAPTGISVETAWNEGAGGAGISIGFAESGFSPSSHPDISIANALGQGVTFSEHMLNVAGILAAQDNDQGIVGVSPLSPLVFSATDATPATGSAKAPANTLVSNDSYVALALLNGPTALKAGDVINLSIAANMELDQGKSPSVAATLPVTRPNRRGNGNVTIAKKPAPSTELEKVSSKVALEIDPALLPLMRLLADRGITVCMAAGNGYEATYLAGTTPVPNVSTNVGADLSMKWLRQTHSMDRADAQTFKDGGSVVVGGGVWSAAKSINMRVPGFNFGNRVDCFAQGSDVATWNTSQIVRVSGSSAATPIVAGCAALIQCYLQQNYKLMLKPLVLRALLSDPLLGTPSQAGDLVGVMPDLAKIFPLLKQAAFDKAKLMAALKDEGAKAQAEVAKTKAAAASGTWVHDPYSVWDENAKKWKPMPLDSESDFFKAKP
ncbi:MAG: S8 family serine peptidase [Rhizobacter sp.]